MRGTVAGCHCDCRGRLGLWQVCGCGDPGAGVGSVLTWTELVLPSWLNGSDPNFTINVFLGATRCSRYSLKIREFYQGCKRLYFHRKKAYANIASCVESRYPVAQVPSIPMRVSSPATARVSNPAIPWLYLFS